MITRRKFVQQSALATAGAALPFPADMLKKKEIFVHQVYFWLKNPDSAADKAALVAGLEKLRTMDVITLTHIGTPAAAHRDVVDASYQVSWLCFFKNSKDQDIYQVHPMHLEFIENCKHLWTKVIVYDSIGK